MKRGIKIKQHDITDCGAACLASVAAHYGLKLPIAKIRQYASTDKKGTNVLGMIEAAQKLGFQAKGVKGKFESLTKIPLPAIVHIIVKETLHHFVVLYKIDQKWLHVMDPGTGQVTKIKYEDFRKEWTGVLILLLPDQDFQKGDEKVSVFRRLWFLLKPHKVIGFQALFGALIYTVIGLSTSVYVQKIVDYVLPEGNQNLLNLLSVVMILLLLLQILINIFKTIFILKTGQKIDAQLILGYYKHLLKLPQQFFDTMRVGEIISRIGDAVKIRAFINEVLIALIVNIFIVLFSFVLMFTYYWKLALIILVIIPLYTLVYFLSNRFNKRVQRKIMERAADLEAQLVESLNAVGTIKRFRIAEYANVKTETRFVQLLDQIFRSGLNSLFSNVSSDGLARLFTIILLWAGSYYVLENVITAGELLSFYALIGYFTAPAATLINMNQTIQDALIASDRLFEIMDLEREQERVKVNLTRADLGNISFKNVAFRYGSRVEVFKDLSLTIPIGSMTALVGESGSGKSTIAALLQNIYPIQNGQILIGRYHIQDISAASMQKLIGVVPQEVDLFAGSLIENIALGDYEPDLVKINQICADLGLSDFISALPNRLYTYIGEHGVNLSGGQRQRVAIARALYRDPEILILDEATAALDSLSEQYVQRVIQSLKAHQKTIILITHRLTSVSEADQIFVLKDGDLVEVGTHPELINRQSTYHKLWKAQHAV